MRFATWNVNGLRARFEYLSRWLVERQPDVVGLQELKLSDDLFPHEAFADLAYDAFCHGQKAWNGVAILIRKGLKATLEQSGLPGQEDLGARLITTTVDDVSFTSVYCPNGKSVSHQDFGRKLQWFDSLTEHMSSTGSSSKAAIVCGDFNICPAALDSWNEAELAGSIFHTDEERQRMKNLIELGFEDLYRRLRPEERAYSWWDYRGGGFQRGLGLRIDLILGTGAVAQKLTKATIDREWRKKKDGLTASDHAPVWVDIE